jgi:hypothetical protein
VSEREKVVTLEITLKSGATVSAQVTTWKWRKAGSDKELSWTTPAKAKRRLIGVDLDDVAAIVEVR